MCSILNRANLHLLGNRIDKDPPQPSRWETIIDWNGAVLPARSAQF